MSDLPHASTVDTPHDAAVLEIWNINKLMDKA